MAKTKLYQYLLSLIGLSFVCVRKKNQMASDYYWLDQFQIYSFYKSLINSSIYEKGKPVFFGLIL